MVFKEVIGNELYVYMNGSLLYKRWLKTGQSLVFDKMPYNKHTIASITDKGTFKQEIEKL